MLPYTPVIAGMDAAVASKLMGGWSTPIPGIILYGKTGTSQTLHIRINAVFMAFAPKDNPQNCYSRIDRKCRIWCTVGGSHCFAHGRKYLRGYIEAPYRVERKRDDEAQSIIPPKREKMIISAIVAVAENGVIGYQGEIPWHLSSDFKFLKENPSPSHHHGAFEFYIHWKYFA